MGNCSSSHLKKHEEICVDKLSAINSGTSIPTLEIDDWPTEIYQLIKNGPLHTYGELVILGYNGCLPQRETGRVRSKFVLGKRSIPNGVIKSQQYVVEAPLSSKAILSTKQHSMSYSLSRNQAVIVECMPDDKTDMFQIGRSSENPIDFVIIDTIPGDKTADVQDKESPTSRFACRILISRNENCTARVYAAGFNSSRNIFLGEKAIKWQHNGEVDGFTTNGILIMHPRGSFCDSPQSGVWREISVEGDVYALRKSGLAPQERLKIVNETNVLQDGSLINLCGATLLWRSAEGLSKSPTKHHLEEKVVELNAGHIRCPVRLNSLVMPMKSQSMPSDKQPYVYLVCGHVQGLHNWGQNKETNERPCPMCRKIGTIAKLRLGIESSFYIDGGPPTFAFNPCGHTASEKTVKYWASVSIQTNKFVTNRFQAACPFCATPLQGDPGYIRLFFQDHID